MTEVVVFHPALGVLSAQPSPRRGLAGAARCSAPRPCRSASGATNWPGTWSDGVRVHVHIAEGDDDLKFAQRLATTVPASELFVHSGPEHDLAEHDEHPATVLRQRVLAFLGEGHRL